MTVQGDGKTGFQKCQPVFLLALSLFAVFAVVTLG